MANTYISRAATGSITSDKTFTFSFWLKRGDLGRTQTVFMHENASGHYEKFQLELQSDNTFRISIYDGSVEFNYDTNMLFRDVNAWYNIIVRFDTTQSTSTDRVRIYVNGSQITFDNANGSTATMPNQNFALNLGQKIMVWGRYQASSPGAYFNGSLSHCHYADGQSYAPTVFGEVDSTTGEWKIKNSPTVTYGNNGFFILKDGNRVVNDAGNSSGNFAVSGGTLTKTEDNPDNVFATLNPLSSFYYGGTFSNGNCSTVSGANGYYSPITSTLGMLPTSGKYYAEVKFDVASTTIYSFIGITGSAINQTNINIGGRSQGYAYAYNGQKFNNNSGTSYGAGYVEGDIIGIAFDATNSKIYFSKNGTWQNSGDPTSGATGTGAAFTVSTTPFEGFYFFGCSDDNNGTGTSAWSWNFGNGYFGTSAVASAGTNASSNGIFEYDVPTGYTALSTKGLNL